MLLFTTAFIVAALGPANGQYYPRPYQMAIQNGFSPYHPARINHETLPISQAEFAQLVAESMATSHGPHHHHPPNTDADYEGPDHARHDAEMLRSPSDPYSHYQPNSHSHNYHHQHHHQHHQHHQQHRPSHHDSQAQYQPDDHYHHDDQESYHRAPVYEQPRKSRHEQSEERYPPQQQQQQEADEEDDEADAESEGVEQYGGRPSSDYQPTSGYEGRTSGYMNNYEEEPSRDQYMAASEHIPIKIIPLKQH